MRALVIGGGPAGLMAAERLCAAGVQPVVVEAKPSLARKFLMAGKSGLNLTKMEPLDRFLSHYDQPELAPMIRAFTPEDMRDWAEDLGQSCFTGSTGRLFPKAMKASPLLRAWIGRLNKAGCSFRTRWRWSGWQDGAFAFDTPEGTQILRPDVCVLALGGASWARLGSDGAWGKCLAERGIDLTPFRPSNVGVLVNWSKHMAPHFGAPLKNIRLSAGRISHRGEAVISARGLEGGGVYPLSPELRNDAPLRLDLLPDLDLATLTRRLSKPRGKTSMGSFLRKTLKWPAQAQALLMECARPLPAQPQDLAAQIKDLHIPYSALRPMDEAISTVGGVPFSELDDGLMLRNMPGVFVAGEMIDWDAPTGGYLLTACMATGRWAGDHAVRYLNGSKSFSGE